MLIHPLETLENLAKEPTLSAEQSERERIAQLMTITALYNRRAPLKACLIFSSRFHGQPE